MADFNYNYHDWGNDLPVEEIDPKKLSKEEQKELLEIQKQQKLTSQAALREQRLAEMMALEEAEKKKDTSSHSIENLPNSEQKDPQTKSEEQTNIPQEEKNISETSGNDSINVKNSKAENKSSQEKKPANVSKTPKEVPTGEEETGDLESPNLDKSDASTYLNSLGNSSPTDFMVGMSESRTTIQELQQQEQTELKDTLPEIEQPTGLPTKDEKGKTEKGSKLAKGSAKHLKTQPKTKENPKDKVKVEANIDPNKPTPTQKQRAGVVERIKSFFASLFGSGAIANRIEEIKDSIDTIPFKDDSIKEDLGKKPEVRLVGEADPEQNEQQKEQAEQQSQENKQKADQEIQKDFGENNLYPELKREKLKPQMEIVALEKTPEISLQKVEKLPSQAIATFNENAKQQIDQKIQQSLAKEKTGKIEKEAKSAEEKKQTDDKIAQENTKVEAEQKKIQKSSQHEVEQNRKNWKQENEQILQKATLDLDTEKKKADTEITQNSEQTNREISQEYEKGDKEIKQEKINTEKKAEAKKSEAKNKKKGFWESIGDAFSSFIEGIKNAINAMFDALKKFVKNTIERVKKAAVYLIDKAKNFAIKMVRKFGEFAKGVVSIVLFAFPETAKKINGLIDKAVDKAEQAINYLAEKLKVAVCKLLDALGAVLVALLNVYQALCLAMLGDFSMIADFLLKIYNGVKGLIQGARHAVSESLGALSEEFLGADITKPLDIERSQEEENQYKASQLASQTHADKKENEQNNQLSDKNKLNNDDVTAPGTPFSLGQEFAPMFSKLQEGQEMVLGGAGENAVTTHDLQNAMFGGNPLTQQGEDEMVANLSNQLSQTENSTPENVPAEAPSPNVTAMTDEQKMDYYIGQMDAEARPESMETKQPPEAPQKVNLDPSLKTSPLPVATRLEYVGRQMMKGLQMWWNQNKMTVYAVVAGVLTVGAIIAFFTGGAGLIAVLQVLMQALTAIFIAEALVRIKGHLMNYLELSWNQKPKEGGKELAKAFAVLVSEFLFEYLLAKLGNVLKRVKATVKATRGFRKARVAANRVKKKVTHAILNIPGVKQLRNVVVKNGKYVINGLNNGITKGVKNLQELRERILKVFGFKRVWAEKHGSKVEIWGEFNSHVLIATLDAEGKPKNTKLDDIDDANLEFVKKPKLEGGAGYEIKVKGTDQKGFMLGDDFPDALYDRNILPENLAQEYMERLQKVKTPKERRQIMEQIKVDIRVDIDGTTKEAAKKYLQKFPDTTYTVDELIEKFNDPKYAINKDTGHFNLIDGNERIFTKEARPAPYEPTTRTTNYFSPEELAEVNKRLEQRDLALQERGSDFGTDHYNKGNAKVNKASEQIAEEVAAAYIEKKFGKNSKPVYVGEGRSTLDQVHIYEKDGKIIIIETKGKVTKPKKDDLTGAVSKTEYYQQGTEEYLREILAKMKRSGDPEKEAIADAIEQGLRNSKTDIEYLWFHQQIEMVGGKSSLGDFTVQRFEMPSKFVRGVPKSDFVNSVAEFKNGLDDVIIDQAWNLWGQKRWGELEELFKHHNLNYGWPPNRGFIDYKVESLAIGTEIDRYGGFIDKADNLFKDKGNFVSPLGASFESRALPADTLSKPYKKYRVIKEIPNVKKGLAAPWFNQPGMGTQFELPENIYDLLKGGYIEEII